MRHLRTLALCLAAVFALTATTLAVASPALASGCNQECKELKQKEKEEAKAKKQKEKEEAKRKKEEEKYLEKHPNGGVYEKFYECPIEITENGCIFGEAGPESFFQAGKVTVPFVHPVDLQIGFIENEAEEFSVVGARNGESIVKTTEPGPSLTEGFDAEALPASEKTRYEEYLANGGSAATTVTIELAVPATDMYLNEFNLLEENGQGFGFDVMIHIQNKFLGNACYDGTTQAPIDVPFTTGETSPPPPNTPIHGTLGRLSTEAEGEILKIGGQHLVDNEYAAPGVTGCGHNGGADAAVDAGFGLPSPAGSNTTILVGNLYQSGVTAVREHIKL